MTNDVTIRRALERVLDQWEEGQLNRLQVAGQLANCGYFLMELELKDQHEKRLRELASEG